MADVNINTQSAGYQNRLSQIREIKQFYGPLIVEWMESNSFRRKKWRANDPILHEIIDIYEKISKRAGTFGD